MINNSVENPIDSEVLNGPKNPTSRSSSSTSNYKKNNTANYKKNSSSFIGSLFDLFSSPASQSNTIPSRSSSTPINSYFYSLHPPPPPATPTQPAQTTIPIAIIIILQHKGKTTVIQ